MLKIYLARHGQDLDNVKGVLNGRRDMPLSEKGIEQAGLVASELKALNINFDKIYSSPLKRALQTAELIAETVGDRKPEILENLIERDFGVMTGEPKSQIEPMRAPEIVKTDTITYFLSPEGAETFPQLVTRSEKILSYLKGEHGNDDKILLVTHGDIGKMIYCAYYKLNWRDVLTMFHFGNSEILLLSEESQPEDVYVVQTQQYNT